MEAKIVCNLTSILLALAPYIRSVPWPLAGNRLYNPTVQCMALPFGKKLRHIQQTLVFCWLH